MEERRQLARRESDNVNIEVEFIKKDINTLAETIQKMEDRHTELKEILDRVEAGLKHHSEYEHKDLKEIVNWAKGSAMAVKIIGIMVAIIAGAASAWAWITGHFTIVSK